MTRWTGGRAGNRKGQQGPTAQTWDPTGELRMRRDPNWPSTAVKPWRWGAPDWGEDGVQLPVRHEIRRGRLVSRRVGQQIVSAGSAERDSPLDRG